MNASFQHLMAEATRLTRAGDLQGATAAIQAALGGAAMPAVSPDSDVIDVQAREVREEKASEGVNESGVSEQRAGTCPVKAQSTAVARATASICNAEWARSGVMSGHVGFVHTFSAPPKAAPRAGQFIAGIHADAGRSLEYKLYIPPGCEGKRMPLVVMLHGCTQDPDDFAAGTRMNDAALERGFFVLYPAQAQKANTSRCWNWFKHNHQRRGQGEPAVLAGMTRDVMKRHDIDPRRVYVAGLSAGGAMAAILGDAYPDMYAAVGVHSGLPPGSATNVQSAFAAMKNGAPTMLSREHTPPTIVFHGDQDPIVSPINGEQVVASHAGAGSGTPEVQRACSDHGRAYTRRTYRDATGRVAAEHWSVHGAGHAWSGGSPRGSYTDATGPDATEEMLRFFFSNELRANSMPPHENTEPAGSGSDMPHEAETVTPAPLYTATAGGAGLDVDGLLERFKHWLHRQRGAQ